MQCYVCARAGKQTEAVGICIVCGMGLCMEHVIREDVDIWEGGYPFPQKKGKKKLPRILCEERWPGSPGQQNRVLRWLTASHAAAGCVRSVAQ